mgnify:CR=1 FL=1|jgi:hypothetical protein
MKKANDLRSFDHKIVWFKVDIVETKRKLFFKE